MVISLQTTLYKVSAFFLIILLYVNSIHQTQPNRTAANAGLYSDKSSLFMNKMLIAMVAHRVSHYTMKLDKKTTQKL